MHRRAFFVVSPLHCKGFLIVCIAGGCSKPQRVFILHCYPPATPGVLLSVPSESTLSVVEWVLCGRVGMRLRKIRLTGGKRGFILGLAEIR